MGAFEEDVLLDMAFGAPEMMHLPLPSTQMQEGNYGCGRTSVRRCRALVASAALSIQDAHLQAAVDRDSNFTVRCMKLGWDETEVRLYCSLRRAQHLFPSLRYSEEDELWMQKAKSAKSMKRKRPCFRMQCMQQIACVKVGDEADANFILAPKLVKSTDAPNLYAAASGFTALPILKRGLTGRLNNFGDGSSNDASSGVLLMSCHMDSLEANKNVFTKNAMDNEEVLCHSGICEGRLSDDQHVV